LWNISVNNCLAGCASLGNNYFNSEVMLLNLYELMKSSFYNKWKKYIEDNLNKIDCCGQSILNIVMGHMRDSYAKYAKMTDWQENLKFRFVRPVFFLHIKFWKVVKKRGILLVIY
jgi:lipopolysaccharide biosynthesis glycosyltransferase